MKRRLLYLLGVALLIAFAGFAFTTFRDGLTPYLTFAEARDTARTGPGRTLQVAGALVKDSSSYDDGVLSFTISEPKTGQTMRVRYRGVKPANFEDAISVVAIGRYHAGLGPDIEASHPRDERQKEDGHHHNRGRTRLNNPPHRVTPSAASDVMQHADRQRAERHSQPE